MSSSVLRALIHALPSLPSLAVSCDTSQAESALAEYVLLGEDFEGVVQQYADTKVRAA